MTMKRGIIFSASALVLGIVGVIIYFLGDHEPPQLKTVALYQADCGTPVTVDELVTEVKDQGNYTVTLSGAGEVTEDGKSICFTKAGTFVVVVEARDARGKSTTAAVPVTTQDVLAPELLVQDITVHVGEKVDYQSAVKAEDVADGDLSAKVQVADKQVNLKKAGTYTVVYTVADSSGNRAEKSGLVVVQPVEASGIQLNRSTLFLSGNQYTNLKATVSPRSWAGTVEWRSDDPAIATVSDGLVAWAGKGSCEITASADGQTARCWVTCGGVAATSVRLDRDAAELTKGDTMMLTADSAPSNWKGTVLWQSSDEQVATVENGTVTGVGPGNCTITAMAGKAKATCQITCHRRSIIRDASDMWRSFMEQ